MITLELNVLGLLDEMIIETCGLNVEFEGYEDYGGPNFNTRYEFVERIRFKKSSEAATFILQYGDKYRPSKTNVKFTPGFAPF